MINYGRETTRLAPGGSGAPSARPPEDGQERFPLPEGHRERVQGEGPQKLRFYCQVCAKQCRDQMGSSATSRPRCLRQMELFGQNQSRFIDGYSEEFLKEFLQLMSISHRNSRVAANVVYNEFIANKQHTHMNGTRWTSLTEFVKHLGREGIATVDETPKGFPDVRPGGQGGEDAPAVAEAPEGAGRRLRARPAPHRGTDRARLKDRADQARRRHRGDGASARLFCRCPSHGTGLRWAARRTKTDTNETRVAPNALNAFGEDGGAATKTRKRRRRGGESATVTSKKRARWRHRARGYGGAGEENLPNDETIPWLLENLVVKIMSSKRDAVFDKKKARRENARRRLRRRVRFVRRRFPIDGGARGPGGAQTVLPAVGRVAVVKGAMRGKRGTLMALETESFRAVVDVDGEARKFEYDDVCKVVAADA